MLGIPMSVVTHTPRGTQKLWPPQPRRWELGSPLTLSPSLTSEDSSIWVLTSTGGKAFSSRKESSVGAHTADIGDTPPGEAPHKALRG